MKLLAGKEEAYYVDHAELARVSEVMEKKIHSVRQGENCLRYQDADVPVVENLLSWANIRVYKGPRSMDIRIVSNHLVAFGAVQDLFTGGRRQRQITRDKTIKDRTIYYQLDWTKLLMQPAQLYVLADRFQIPALKARALKYLTSCLKHAKKKYIFRSQLGQKGGFVEAFTQVVNFCFENLILLQTPVSIPDLPKAERVEEPILRSLTGFAAKNLARLKNYPEFVGMMEKNPQFCIRLLITGKCKKKKKEKNKKDKKK